MMNIRHFLFLLFALGTLESCEDKLQFSPEDPVFKYVIEGIVQNETGSCKVTISQSKNFEDANTFVGVSKAVVQIENKGLARVLTETSPGIYQDLGLKGVPGQTYKLTVKIGNQEFNAVSKMPAVVRFVSFSVNAADYDPVRTVTKIGFKDPPGLGNYYWFQELINNNLQRRFKVLSDEFVDGQNISEYLVYENRTKDATKNIMKGDKLIAEMHCIEAPVYTYLFSLSGADGSGEGLPAANPQGNISGGALGFFSAQTVERKTVVVP